LLHDIADSKFNNGDEVVGPETARTFLESEGVDEEIINHVIKIIENISYKVVMKKSFASLELDIVQDADRLDALGAIELLGCLTMEDLKTERYTTNIAEVKMTKRSIKE
jgi:uncharacterized protein